MSRVVGAFWLPHNPVMYAAPMAASEEQRERVSAAYAECARRLAELRPTTLIIVGNDHYILFGTECLPRYLIGTGDIRGSLGSLPGLDKLRVSNNEELAGFIAQHGFAHGFDWSVARSFSVDHAISIPHHLVVQPAQRALGVELPCIPVYLACAVDPYLSLQRAAELGREIGEAVAAFPGDERVVVIGSGGLSHWVGTAEMGRVDEAFDHEVLAHGVAGDLDALCAYRDEEIVERAGNGAMEIRNLICALAAVAEPKGEVVAYEPVEPWVTGMGFLAITPAQ